MWPLKMPHSGRTTVEFSLQENQVVLRIIDSARDAASYVGAIHGARVIAANAEN